MIYLKEKNTDQGRLNTGSMKLIRMYELNYDSDNVNKIKSMLRSSNNN